MSVLKVAIDLRNGISPKENPLQLCFRLGLCRLAKLRPYNFGVSKSRLRRHVRWKRCERANDGWEKIIHHIVEGLAAATGLHLTAK